MRGGAQARIIHGNRAKAPIPWQVSLQTSVGGFHFCGGTILDKTTILSAAHCFQNRIGTKSYVLAGKVTKYSYDRIRIARVIIHPLKSKSRQHDIAIIKLSKPLPFGISIQPMCLPSKDFKPKEGEMCFVSGWGRTKFCKNFQQIRIF